MYKRHMKRYTLEEKIWLKENYSLLGSNKCSEFLKRPLSSVRQTANKMGCKISLKLRNELHSKTLINNFIPSILPSIFKNVKIKEVAYILGLLWADGWIKYKNSYDVNIKLISEDFNFGFNKQTGYTETWGKTKEDNPDFCQYGPLIADIEISTVCTEGCKFCVIPSTNILKDNKSEIILHQVHQIR